jgi:DNA-binding transcriptional ArsR family regulator
MSRKRRSSVAERGAHAPMFAALGDATRLSLVTTLCAGQRQSISQLAKGSNLTRQAITKHLRVLEGAGLVRSVRLGRESLFAFEVEPIEQIKTYLDLVSEQWDQAFVRLEIVRRRLSRRYPDRSGAAPEMRGNRRRHCWCDQRRNRSR